VFVVDADERLAPESLPACRALLDAPRDRGYRFTTRNYTNSTQVAEFVPAPPGDHEALGFAGWFPSVKVRLFPRDPEIRFEHPVHEVVTPSLTRKGYAVLHSDIPVLHYPLLKDAAQVRRKQEMYIALGLKKVQEQPGNAQAYAELGAQYVDMGEVAQAARAFREAVRLAPDNGEYLKDFGATLYLLRRHEDARRTLALAVQRAPGLLDAWRNLGVVNAEQGNWEEARRCFERALDLQPSNPQLQQYLALAREKGG
jgi:hypothetical protein